MELTLLWGVWWFETWTVEVFGALIGCGKDVFVCWNWIWVVVKSECVVVFGMIWRVIVVAVCVVCVFYGGVYCEGRLSLGKCTWTYSLLVRWLIYIYIYIGVYMRGLNIYVVNVPCNTIMTFNWGIFWSVGD